MKQTETTSPEKFSDLVEAHRQNSSRESGPGYHHCCVCDAYWAHMSFVLPVGHAEESAGTRCVLLNKGRVLALERLGGTGAPELGDGLRVRIGEDVLFSLFQPSKNLSGR